MAGGVDDVAGGRGCESNVPPTNGPGEERGRARARPSCVRADANQAQKWAGNGSAGGRKRTRARLGRRVGPSFLFVPTQTDAVGRNGSPHWSCSNGAAFIRIYGCDGQASKARSRLQPHLVHVHVKVRNKGFKPRPRFALVHVGWQHQTEAYSRRRQQS